MPPINCRVPSSFAFQASSALFLPGGVFAHMVCVVISVLNSAALCTELTLLTAVLANVNHGGKTGVLHKS